MRVVGGSARGRPLRPPKGADVRPTSDRTRESIFNVLMSLGGVEGATVADLFAGTGALGIEALSRGAAHATFVDRDVGLVRTNLEAVGLADRATVVRADVLRWVESAPAVDLAFADPPYAFDDWLALLARLEAGLAVLESDRPIEPGERWRVLRTKQYGSTVVVVAQPNTGD
ncbi:MAG TPA: RsmD family RNA methyltransferase, partial [Acidimicrobiales bacterium]|nr:RsmD family RNA methyltransferase [Acidimicrobiales bacterium]